MSIDTHTGTLVVDLAFVSGVAAVTSMLARFLGQPSILGYLFAGLIVGPYIPIPLFADPERMSALAEVGVVLVMFAVGLEFRLRRLVDILPVSGLTAIVQIAALAWAGHSVGVALGWTSAACITLGATLAISSTMVVTAVLREHPVDDDVRAHVFGILVVQDLVAIVLMAIVTALASGQHVGVASLGRLVAQLGMVVAGMLVLGLMVLPATVRLAVRRFDSEVLVVVVVGAAFGLASVAEAFGYSVALGAFVAGMATAESGLAKEVEHAIESLRALFAAIFFVSIGMTVDPRMAWQSLPLALGLATVVIVTQFVAVTFASILGGNSLRRSVFAAVTLGQIGELSFILATIAIGGGVLPSETLPALVTVATLTAFTTPFLLTRAQSIVDALDRLVPDRVQHVLSAYQAFTRRGRSQTGDHLLRRSIVAVLLDWSALLLIYLGHRAVTAALPSVEPIALNGGAALLATPFLVGLIRSGRQLTLASRRLAREDSNAAPTPRAVAVEAVAWSAILIAIGVPTAAVIQPFLAGPWANVLVVAGLVLVLVAVGLRYRAVRPGVTSEVAQLALQIADQLESAAQEVEQSPRYDPLGGLDYELLEVATHGGGDGVTLAELNLRCETGATVVAIRRHGTSIPLPTGQERLRAGDQLAVSGSEAAIARARGRLGDVIPDGAATPAVPVA